MNKYDVAAPTISFVREGCIDIYVAAVAIGADASGTAGGEQ